MSKFVLNVHSNEGTIYVYSNEVYKDPWNSEHADQNISLKNLRFQQPQNPAGSQNENSFHTSQTRFPYTQQFSAAQAQSASNLPHTNSGAQQTTNMNYPQPYNSQNWYPSSFWSLPPTLNLQNPTFPMSYPKSSKSELTKINEEAMDTNEQKVADEITKKDNFEPEIKIANLPKAQNKKGKK